MIRELASFKAVIVTLSGNLIADLHCNEAV
jgi:hypothetical protein